MKGQKKFATGLKKLVVAASQQTCLLYCLIRKDDDRPQGGGREWRGLGKACEVGSLNAPQQ